jgi:predicted nuclease with TOPRIM domain
MDVLNAAQRMQMIEKFETLTIKEYGVLVYENEQLRQRVAELEGERDEWRGKHDIACLTITNLQSKYECQLSATSKAMQGVAELTAERDDLMKSIHDQADRYDELSQELELSDALQRDKVVKLTAIPTDITQILDEVRKQERERCAALCEKSDRYRGDYFAAKIRAME